MINMIRLIIPALLVISIASGQCCTAMGEAADAQQPTAAEPAQFAEATRLSQTVMQLYRQGRYDQALPLAKRVVEIAQSTFGPADAHVAVALRNVAELLVAKKDFVAADKALNQSTSIFAASQAHGSEAALMAWQRLGWLRYERKEFSSAVAAFKRALEISEKRLGPQDIRLVEAIWDLANAFSADERFVAAEHLGLRALRIQEKQLGPSNPKTIEAMKKYACGVARIDTRTSPAKEEQDGFSDDEKGLNARAICWTGQLRNDCADSNGPPLSSKNLVRGSGVNTLATHIDLPFFPIQRGSIGNGSARVAVLIDESGKVITAKAVCGDTTSRFVRVAMSAARGAVFPPARGQWKAGSNRRVRDVQLRLPPLVLVNQATRIEENGARVMKQAILLLIVLLSCATKAQPGIPAGQTKPTAAAEQLAEAARLNSSAVELYGQAKYDEAAAAAKRALDIREEFLTRDDALLTEAVLNLAEIQLTRGKTADAEGLYKRALASYGRRFGEEDRRLVSILNRLAIAYDRMAMPYEIERVFKRGVAIQEKALGPDHPAVGEALFRLAEFYQFQGQYKSADPLYQRLIAIREKAGVGPEAINEARDRYGCLLRKENRLKEAADLEVLTFSGMNPTLTRGPSIEGGVLNGRAVSLVQPEYPQEAKARRIRGKVTVRVLIDQAGRVIRACAIEGSNVFVRTAESAALGSRFTPTLLSGQQVRVSGVIVYNFQ